MVTILHDSVVVASRRQRRRAYAPTINTASHDNHEKINSCVSFAFLYGYEASLGGSSGRRSSAISLTLTDLVFFSLQVVWCHWNLFTLLQDNTTAGNGHEGSWAHLSSWVLRLPSLPVQILCWRQVFPSLPCSPVRGWLLWRHKHFPANPLLHVRPWNIEYFLLLFKLRLIHNFVNVKRQSRFKRYTV